jgi:hypothetical protein
MFSTGRHLWASVSVSGAFFGSPEMCGPVEDLAPLESPKSERTLLEIQTAISEYPESPHGRSFKFCIEFFGRFFKIPTGPS